MAGKMIKKCEHASQDKCPCKWTVRYRDPAGKQREKSFTLKTDARNFMVKAEHSQREGVYLKESGVTFGEYAAQCIANRTGSASTKARYAGVLANHLSDIAGRKLSDVAKDRDGIKRLLLVTLPSKGLGRAQCEICQVVITSTVTEAIRAGKLTAHNLSGIRLPAVDRSADFYIPGNAEVEKLAAGMPAEWSLTVWLARGCGLRHSEALAVKVSDFSRDRKTLRISEQTLTATTTGPLKARKPGESRTVPVPAYVVKALRAHMAVTGIRDGYLFAGRQTRFVPETSFNAAWGKARTAAGLPAFRFHDLRHTYASRLLSARPVPVPLPDVSRWLGHKDVNVTYRVYSHFIPESFGHARDVLDADWNGTAEVAA